jgi:hypothetical protein
MIFCLGDFLSSEITLDDLAAVAGDEILQFSPKMP